MNDPLMTLRHDNRGLKGLQYHDASFLGISLDENSCRILVKESHGDAVDIELRGLKKLQINSFLEGNTISELNVLTVGEAGVGPPRIAGFICGDLFKDSDLFIEVVSSYGADAFAICEAIEIKRNVNGLEEVCSEWKACPGDESNEQLLAGGSVKGFSILEEGAFAIMVTDSKARQHRMMFDGIQRIFINGVLKTNEIVAVRYFSGAECPESLVRALYLYDGLALDDFIQKVLDRIKIERWLLTEFECLNDCQLLVLSRSMECVNRD